MKARFVVMAVIVILFSCRQGGFHSPASGTEESRAASRFVLDSKEGYTILTVRDPWQNTKEAVLSWCLLPEDTPVPEGFGEEQVIRIPVRRMICMSVTHLAMLRALDATDVLVGISGPGLVYDSLILEAIAGGRLPDVGYEGSLDNELIISLKPDLLMAYGVAAPATGQTERLRSMGVKVLYNADYLEDHPLARCEWIRIFGLLTGREAMADSIFRAVSEAYAELADLVSDSVHDRPVVLLGAPWEDVWYVSPGNSYTGRLIDDAGGYYLFRDLSKPNSVPYSVEAVFERAAGAEVWLNPGTALSLDDISAADHRLAHLPVFAVGNIWNNRNRITPGGGNDYWESGVTRPDLLLSDIISILHPELLPQHRQFFYTRLK